MSLGEAFLFALAGLAGLAIVVAVVGLLVVVVSDGLQVWYRFYRKFKWVFFLALVLGVMTLVIWGTTQGQ
ncbi:Uncharacterised protein [Mycobacterium tuberculosis]|nr:Uncharacterised protein [Mycobacterium tuberculosis]